MPELDSTTSSTRTLDRCRRRLERRIHSRVDARYRKLAILEETRDERDRFDDHTLRYIARVEELGARVDAGAWVHPRQRWEVARYRRLAAEAGRWVAERLDVGDIDEADEHRFTLLLERSPDLFGSRARRAQGIAEASRAYARARHYGLTRPARIDLRTMRFPRSRRPRAQSSRSSARSGDGGDGDGDGEDGSSERRTDRAQQPGRRGA